MSNQLATVKQATQALGVTSSLNPNKAITVSEMNALIQNLPRTDIQYQLKWFENNVNKHMFICSNSGTSDYSLIAALYGSTSNRIDYAPLLLKPGETKSVVLTSDVVYSTRVDITENAECIFETFFRYRSNQSGFVTNWKGEDMIFKNQIPNTTFMSDRSLSIFIINP